MEVRDYFDDNHTYVWANKELEKYKDEIEASGGIQNWCRINLDEAYERLRGQHQ